MKTVLVTGGTTRLGRVIAAELRARGWRVLTTSHRPEAGADLTLDFTREWALPPGEPPDALVNNAALFTGTSAELRAVNLEAPKRLMAWMASRSAGTGAVVNILDCRVLRPPSGPETDYAVLKRALLDETRRAARVYASKLRVNAVAPGPVMVPAEVHEKAGPTPLGRPSPEEVASAVAFLLEASTTSNCIVPVDGGQSLV